MTRTGSRTIAVIAASLAVTGSLVGCGADAQASEDTVRWLYDYFPTAADLPILAAQERGFFADAGITVETTPGGEINQIQDVGIGNHDITVGPAVTLLMSRQEGLPVKSIGVVQPTNPAGLICNPDIGLDPDDPATLAGKTIGVNSTDADTAISWDPFRDLHGLTGKVVEVQTDYDISALFSGQVDCYPNFLTQSPAQAAAHYGKPPVLYRSSETAGALGQALVTNETFASEHPETVSKFVAAYGKGMAWTMQNPEAAIELMVKTYPETDPDAAAAELAALVTFWHTSQQDENGLLYSSTADWQDTASSLQDLGVLTSAPDLSAAFDGSFLPTPAVLPE